ncbi:MAG: hypothetical protein Ct9H300mP7_6320 [Verrucomicrobiota bacterium]|nr:MAG: hypothetical protein Ct9H300mP7_6320 [Verrucomicrobiota bacterium]
MGFGGSITYGQTIGLTHDGPLIGNWASLRWGMLGLAIKGVCGSALPVSFSELDWGQTLSAVRDVSAGLGYADCRRGGMVAVQLTARSGKQTAATTTGLSQIIFQTIGNGNLELS